jgi:mono/diheme cytochrome c family protein
MLYILLYLFSSLFLLWMILLSFDVRRHWLNVMLFSLAATIAYSILGNMIPQIESRPAPEVQLSEAATPEQLVKAGEQIFYGKGTCALCHSIEPSETARCPPFGAGSLGPVIGMRAEERVREPGYKGKAKNGTAYIIESMIDPLAYVVKGFPPIMPVINKPPIGLSPAEMAAVAAYLQSVQGGKVTVTLKEVAAFIGGEAPAAQPAVATMGDRPPEQLINDLACVGCHKFDTPGPLVGPSLWDVGARRDEAYIRQKILNPQAIHVEGFPAGVMPQDLAQRMSGLEFERLVQWLEAHKGAQTQ